MAVAEDNSCNNTSSSLFCLFAFKSRIRNEKMCHLKNSSLSLFSHACQLLSRQFHLSTNKRFQGSICRCVLRHRHHHHRYYTNSFNQLLHLYVAADGNFSEMFFFTGHFCLSNKLFFIEINSRFIVQFLSPFISLINIRQHNLVNFITHTHAWV